MKIQFADYLVLNLRALPLFTLLSRRRVEMCFSLANAIKVSAAFVPGAD
jgi:hypothetical protein